MDRPSWMPPKISSPYYDGWWGPNDETAEDASHLLTGAHDFYHYAPTSERDRIMQHGLQVSHPEHSEHWSPSEVGEQPQGVYVTTNPEETNLWDKPMDLWRVPWDHIGELQEDPLLSNAYVIPHDVHAELHTPHEESIDFKGRNQERHPVWEEPTDGGFNPKWDYEKPPSEYQAQPTFSKTAYQWHTTPSGNTYWGPLGAAGILFHHPETNTYLLGHRSPEVHHGDTWGIPGGALDPGESPYQAALREAEEEFGHVPQHKVVKEHVAQPDPDWKYHTFVAQVPQQFDPEYHGDWETQDHGWFTPEQIAGLKLHPGFESSWNSGGLTKEAKHGFFYHTAPSQYRQQIEENGLVPTHEAPVSPWADMKGEAREQQPHGVYMWDDPTNARGYAYNLEGRKGGWPGDQEGFDEDVFESPEYEDYMSRYQGEPHTDDYYDYEAQFQPVRKPLYDVWKVNTLGYEPQIDPEMAIHHGELTAEQAQQQMNEQANKNWKGQPVDYDPHQIERSEGHRWYVPHAVEPQRLTLHDQIYPEEMTENNWEDTTAENKQIPNAWHQVPLNEWNQKAQERYLGDPGVMRAIDPQDRTRQ